MIERLRKLAEQATPGPWGADVNKVEFKVDAAEYSEDIAILPGYYRTEDGDHSDQPTEHFEFHDSDGYMEIARFVDDEATAEFIAACDPQTVLRLLDVVQEAANAAAWYANEWNPNHQCAPLKAALAALDVQKGNRAGS